MTGAYLAFLFAVTLAWLAAQCSLRLVAAFVSADLDVQIQQKREALTRSRAAYFARMADAFRRGIRLPGMWTDLVRAVTTVALEEPSLDASPDMADAIASAHASLAIALRQRGRLMVMTEPRPPIEPTA